MILAWTGHRPDKLGGYVIPNPTYNKVRRDIKLVLNGLKPDKVICGMALGVDQWVAELCIEMKIPFIAAIPFKGQEKAWPKKAQEHYHELLAKAVEIVIVSEGDYHPSKMYKRNKWMVDNSDILGTVFDGSKGGTFQCVKYAKKMKHQVVTVTP